MESRSPLIEATHSPGRWLLRCWRLRRAVLDMAVAFSMSPTHVELAELKDAKHDLEQRIISLNDEMKQMEIDRELADQKRLKECEDLRTKYEKRLRATQTDQVEALKTELLAERDSRHLVKIELEALKAKQTRLEEEMQRTREGTRSLLRFIRVRNTPDINLAKKPVTNAELFS